MFTSNTLKCFRPEVVASSPGHEGIDHFVSRIIPVGRIAFDVTVQPRPRFALPAAVLAYASVGIMTDGVIWVTATGANVDGAAVTIGTGAGAADAIGDIAADATHIATGGWVFDDTTTATGLARIAKR